MTFRELDERSNQLAQYLREQFDGLGNDTEQPAVAIMLERSSSLVTALLAVMKAGGVYVPLDPKYPTERITFILDDTRAPILLTEQRWLNRLPDHSAHVVCLDADDSIIRLQPSAAVESNATPDSLAYIVYTSGSTGTPKGVLGTHRGTVNRFASIQSKFPFAAGEVACYKSPFTFVDSILELLAPLTNGIPVVIVPNAVVQDAGAFVDMLARHHVTRIILVPSLLTVLLDTQHDLAAKLPKLQYWIAGGEAVSAELRDTFYAKLPNAVLINLYGASEASGDSTIHDTRETRHLPFVPIGRPIANTQVYILDPAMQTVPIGVRGELYVGGVSLARGYLHQPQLTEEKFISSPFGAGRLYRTGDFACYLPDGNIRYLGRSDQQWKVRGMRVEGGEIEALLRRHPRVADAAVLLRRDDGREARLVAYVLAPAADFAPDELQSYLRSHLPEHLVPREFVRLDRFPLTSSGKTDRLRLPSPPPPAPETVQQPGNVIETKLAAIWENLLGVAPIGVDKDFFDLGGHSLLAIRMFAEIEKTLGQKLSVATIFQAPTIHTLAQRLARPASLAVWSPLVPIQTKGARPPFFCVHGLGGGVIGYAPLARHMPGQPFYALQAFGQEPGQTPDESIEQMAARYLQVVREVQPRGPYSLGGYSFGALVAYEMAQELLDQGETVALVALVDYAAPNSDYRRVRLNRNLLTGFITNLPAWAQDYAQLDARQQWGRIRRHVHVTPRRAPVQSKQHPEAAIARYFDDPSRIPARRRALIEVHLETAAAYEVKPYAGEITVLRAKRQPLWCSYDPTLGWGQYSEHTSIRLVAGSHRTLLDEPYVRSLARELQRALAEGSSG
jgi:amino acid adenylation domain-containing protein